MISVIHGLTNSGGTLLTVFLSSFNKNKKNQSRYSITFYYLILVKHILIKYALALVVVVVNVVQQSFFLLHTMIVQVDKFPDNFTFKHQSEIL